MANTTMTPTHHAVTQGTTVKRCAFCGEKSEGNYSIHRDGFGEGPEVWLCDDHGAHAQPTCEDIWERIAQRRGA